MVFVDKAYHSQGVATAIMEKMVVSLKLQGFEKITINSSPYGLPFYHKFGFIDIYSEQKKDGFIFTPMQYTPKELWDVYNKDRIKIGKIVERGRTMAQYEYHIVVHVWIKNSIGEYLISKRTPNKHFPNMWECTGGSAVMGDDSIAAAIREANEELGVNLLPDNGRIFKQYINQHHDFPQFSDVRVFDADIPIESIILQEDETCDAMWASKEKINKMIEDGEFIGRDCYPYIDELLMNVPQ